MSNKIEDYLSEDTLVDNKKFCCLSVVSPDSQQKCDQMSVILRGAYETYDEAVERVNYLQNKRNNKYNVWVGQIGYWLPICFDESITPEKQLELLNEEMKNKIKTKVQDNLNYKKRTQDMKDKIKEEQEIIKQKNKEAEEAAAAKEAAAAEEAAEVEEVAEATEAAEVKEVEEVEEATEAAPAMPAVGEVSAPATQEETDVANELNKCNIDNSNNPIKKSDKNDYNHKLTDDNPLKNQTWCCLSFLTPTNSRVYGLKIRGVFSSLEDANELAKNLQRTDIYNHIYVASVGNWLKWDPDPTEIKEQIYENETLNSIFKNKEENSKNLDIFNEQQRTEELEYNMEKELEESSKNQKEIIDKIFE